jgi:pilus assembly protein CpaB
MNRSRFLMIGGLALAIGLLVSYYVYSQMRALSGRGNSGNGVSIVVAAEDISIGKRLDASDVHLVSIPQPAVPPGAFTSVQKVVGRGAILPISKGEFVLPSKLAAANAGAGLSAMIPQGMRALSVRVNDVVAVAGFVQPGSHVDILATGDQNNVHQTSTVLENVLVLAVGKNFDRTSAEAQVAPVITLAVSPDDAQKLALVSQEGRIQLSLRNPLDTKQETVLATRASSVYPGAPPEETKPKTVRKLVAKTTPAPAVPYQVETIRGNKREENKFEDNK